MLLAFFALILIQSVRSGCVEPRSDQEVFRLCQTVAKLRVTAKQAYLDEDGLVRTLYHLKREEVYKGQLETEIKIVSCGGIAAGRSHFRSDFLDLDVGQSYALMLDKNEEGQWTASGLRVMKSHTGCGKICRFLHQGARGKRPRDLSSAFQNPPIQRDLSSNGIPSSKVTLSGYTESGGDPARFTACDGDQAIGYLVDVDVTKLPAGLNEDGALKAVKEALDAWAAVSSLRFRFDGVQSFGVAASSMNVADGRLRLQLHDNFNAISGSGVLGIGGGAFKGASAVFTGGVVGLEGFRERLYGYAVMKSASSSSFLQNVEIYKRVLAHEIGHALGLAHSSEDPSESESLLKNSVMYFQTSTGGVSLNAYDVDRIQFGYPISNTPPYAVDRAISIVTTSSSFGAFPTGIHGLNRFPLRAFDRQAQALTPILASSTSSAGVFQLVGNDLIYTPSNFFNTTRLNDDLIANGSSYDSADIQFTDGTHRSRSIRYNVVGLHADRTPTDGLPDSWMITHFGSNMVGTIGSGKHPNDDPDRDGLTNRLEFQLNTNPNHSLSGAVNPRYEHEKRRIVFTPIRFVPYGVESSQNLELASWTQRGVVTTNQAGEDVNFEFFSSSVPMKEFYRVEIGF